MIGSYTIFSSTATLGKFFNVVDGTVKKTVECELHTGNYTVRSFSTANEFLTQLTEVSGSQVISASVPTNGTTTGGITTRARPRENCLARTKENFKFPDGPGIMTLDYDPSGTVLSREELINLLRTAADIPEDSALLWWCSGSSYIYNGDEEIQGLKGQRIYLLVENARDIPRAGKVLLDRCWLLGYGHIKPSKAGSKLEYSVFDGTMFHHDRLDFIGGAICEEPLSQRRGMPINYGGSAFLDTKKAFRDLSDDENTYLNLLRKEAANAVADDCIRLRQTHMENNREKLEKRLISANVAKQDAPDKARSILRAAYENCELASAFPLELEGGKTLTVKELLDSPTEYHLAKTRDPIDPEHRHGELCGILYLDQPTPKLFSFAGGGVTYTLIRQEVSVELRAGDRAIAAKAIAQALLSFKDLYMSGNSIVKVVGSKFKPQSVLGIGGLIDSRVDVFSRIKDDGRKKVDVKIELVRAVYNIFENDEVITPPVINSVTNCAYATVDRRLVLQPGYNRETGIYNRAEKAMQIPETVSADDVVKALRVIWGPFEEYIWANNTARAGALSALFTAVLRSALPVSYGFLFESPMQNSGKSKAADVICAIAHGDRVDRTPFVGCGPSHETEYQKHITGLIMSGTGYYLLDNITGLFKSNVLAALITSERFSSRALGNNEIISSIVRLLVCVTGNNARMDSDLLRRFICCRIDCGVEFPGALPHTFEPQARALSTRLEIIRSVLMILRAFWASGFAHSVDNSDCQSWGELVRDPIKWIHSMGYAVQAGIGEIDDPKLALGTNSLAEADDKAGSRQLVTGLWLLREKEPKARDWFSAEFVASIYNKAPSQGVSDGSPVSLIRDGLNLLIPFKEKDVITERKLSTNGVSRQLNGIVGHVFGDLKITSRKAAGGGFVWRIEDLSHGKLRLVSGG